VRGSPLLHTILTAIAFALFAVPLSRLTIARPETKALAKSAAPASGPKKQTFLRIRLAHVPKSLSLKLHDDELLPAPDREPSSLIETQLPLAIPTEGLELAISAQWPDGTPDTAVTVELEPDELDARRDTIWSRGTSLSGILFFKW
jgi:hypothetical protein